MKLSNSSAFRVLLRKRGCTGTSRKLLVLVHQMLWYIARNRWFSNQFLSEWNFLVACHLRAKRVFLLERMVPKLFRCPSPLLGQHYYTSDQKHCNDSSVQDA